MAITEAKVGGAVDLRGRVCRSNHRGVPGGLAAPVTRRADWQKSLPTGIDGGQQARYRACQEPVLHDRSKHTNIKFHFLRHCVDGGHIVVEFIETGRQLANILTKSLGRLRFLELRGMIGMVEVKGGQRD